MTTLYDSRQRSSTGKASDRGNVVQRASDAGAQEAAVVGWVEETQDPWLVARR